MFSGIYTDQGIVRRVLRGNTDAFAILLDRYEHIVYGVAFARTGNAADAEEITQDTFVRLYQWLDRIAGRSSVGPWLVEVARNAATDLLRRRLRETPLPSASAELSVAARDFARDELRRMVWEQLADLDETHREVLILHYFQAVKTREIARLLGISNEAAAKRIQRSRNELGRRLLAIVGEETAAARPDSGRAKKVMAAIAAAPQAWQPSPALSLAGAAIVGAGAGKVVMSVAAAAIIIAVGLYAGWRYVNRPYDTQNITAKSEFTVDTKPSPAKPAASAETSAAPAPSPAAPDVSSETPTRPPVPRIVFYGLVLDPAGRPVPGATVTIDNKKAFSYFEAMSKDASYPDAAEPVEASGLTGSDGRFYIESVPIGTSWQLSEIHVAALSTGLYGEEMVRCVAGMPECYVEIGLKPDGSLSGRVIDEAGAPVAEASIDLMAAYHFSGIPGTKTAADGTFNFPHLSAGFYNIYTECRGFMPYRDAQRIEPGRQSLLIRLQRGNSISGRITLAADGSPLADRKIMAIAPTGGNSTQTDPAGRFTISGLEYGTYEMRLGKDGSPYVIVAPNTVDLAENKPTTGLDFKVVQGASVSGKILDQQTGEPVPHTMIRFTAPTGAGNYANTWADALGRFTASPLSPGPYKVLLWSDTDRTETNFTVPSYDDIQGVVFKIAPHPIVRGTVLDAQGNPVAGASVAAAPWKNITQFTSSDASGQFTFALVRSAYPVYVQAYAAGLVSPCQGPIRGGSSVTLTLEPSARIEGVVVDKSGRPVPDLYVAAVPASRDRISLITPEGSLWESSSGIDGAWTRTFQSGSFILDPVLPGAYTLEVYACSSPIGYPAATASASVQAGETLRTRLVLDTGALADIEGAVLLGGAPATGVRVSARAEGEQWLGNAGAMTDESGLYRIANVRPGTIAVTANMVSSGERFDRTQNVQLAAGQTATVNFDIPVSNSGVEGYVTMNGQYMMAYVTVNPAEAVDDSEKITAQPGTRGYYRADVQPGNYQVAVVDIFKPEKVYAVETVEVPATGYARQDFDIAGGAVEGSVAGLREDEKAFVALFPGTTDFSVLSAALGEEIVASAEVLPGGSFSFPNIMAGPYTIAAVAVPAGVQADESTIFAAVAKGRYGFLPVDIVPGETITLDLVIP